MKRSPKQKTISQLKKQADKVFSIFIRNRDKFCITCGALATQNGHYVSRSWLALRYSETNCNGQCVACNIFKSGNMDEYALALKRRYGEAILEELHALKKPHQMKRKDYEAIIESYGGCL